jgi:hypothetical protein
VAAIQGIFILGFLLERALLLPLRYHL